MNEEEKLIENQFKTLPPNLQKAINTVPWKAVVQEIGKANALDTEQITSLEQETMLILYAFEKPDDFIINITREIGINDEKAGLIAEDIANKIFAVIQKKSEETESQPAPEPTKVPEIPPTNLPMVEKEEVVHDVPHVEQPIATPPPTPTAAKPESEIKSDSKITIPENPHYPGGKDPYREPLK